MSEETDSVPPTLLAQHPEHDKCSKKRKISPLVQNDGHDTLKEKNNAGIITSPIALLSLPVELHLCIIDHLPFWDVYALRLTCGHFASITSPLNRHYRNYTLQTQFQHLYNRLRTEGRELINLCKEFNISWLARRSNLSFWTCSNDDCCCLRCGWGKSSFAMMDLPKNLQLRIVENLPFYDVAPLRLTCHYFANIIPAIGKLETEFEALFTETSAAGGDIDKMCYDFNLSWFGISNDATYNEYGVLNEGCDCGRDATSGYSEAPCGEKEDCGTEGCCHECVWGESNYDDYDSWTLKY